MRTDCRTMVVVRRLGVSRPDSLHRIALSLKCAYGYVGVGIQRRSVLSIKARIGVLIGQILGVYLMS